MKCFLEALVSRCHLNLLAQVGSSLTLCIDKDDRQQCSHRDKKKHFHAHRIAQTRQPALYSELADTKQI